MRSRLHFSPAFDCLQARISPSAVVELTPASSAGAENTQVVSAMDDTGSPGTDPSGYGSYPIILTPAPGTGTDTGSMC